MWKGDKPMKIEILGPGCFRCFATEENVRLALGQLGLRADVVHISDHDEFQKRGVKFTPALVIDGKTKSSGRIPEVIEIHRWLREASAGISREASVRR
jgi:small redox-active disulfide protein 2